RSRIRESIKPGKYGYGKVPFALPLHKETAPRFKRHPEPPSDPLLLPTQVPKHKAEEAPRRKKEPPAQGWGTGREQLRAGRAGGEAWTWRRQAHASPPAPHDRAGQRRATEGRGHGRVPRRPLGGGEPDVWLLHRGSPVQFQARGQRPRPGLHPSPEVPQWNLYHPGTETFHCEGESKQFKACRQEPCPADQPDARAVQCAAFNSQEFMGRLYQWEPFTDGLGGSPSRTGWELNNNAHGSCCFWPHAELISEPGSRVPLCRAERLGGRVVSETLSRKHRPVPGISSLCPLMQGRGLPWGKDALSPLPTTRLPLWRPPPSPNPPALRSRSGKSIINGNWAVDPPGRYEAGGTVFVYHPPPSPAHPRPLTYPAQATPGRPSHTQGYQAWTQDLPWPGIFQALLQTPPPSCVSIHHRAPAPIRPSCSPHISSPLLPACPRHMSKPCPLQVRVHISPRSSINPSSLQQVTHLWRCSSPLSVTPRGLWQPLFHCVERHSQEEVEDEHCADIPKPPALDEACNTQPCPAYPCCGECGSPRGCGECGSPRGCGLCRNTAGTTVTLPRPQLHPGRGSGFPIGGAGLLRPWGGGQEGLGADCACGFPQCWAVLPSSVPRREPGGMDLLGDGWMASLSWRPQCSVECGTGIQRRSVVCLSSYANGQAEETCAGTKPADMRACNSGPCQRTVKWYTGPWSQAAGSPPPTGTQRRDVICVSKLGSEFNVTEASECAPREKPPSLQPCTGTACDARWFSTSWSACSKSCVGGVQVREVQCLTQNKTFSHLCPPDLKPVKKRACNTQPC
uniref:ADAMTS like 4 n=1 Tax=Pelodiscus sinensis TaxID=13735 RepID=K7FQF5_PELSI